jgi:hypothetical protein
MSVGAINIASRGLVLNNSVGSVNLFPWVHYETIQRGQLSRNPLAGNEQHNKDNLHEKCRSTKATDNALFYHLWINNRNCLFDL